MRLASATRCELPHLPLADQTGDSSGDAAGHAKFDGRVKMDFAGPTSYLGSEREDGVHLFRWWTPMHPKFGSRRRHSEELKAKVLAACDEPGASISGVALAHGLNTKLKFRPKSDEFPL